MKRQGLVLTVLNTNVRPLHVMTRQNMLIPTALAIDAILLVAEIPSPIILTTTVLNIKTIMMIISIQRYVSSVLRPEIEEVYVVPMYVEFMTVHALL